MLFIAHQRGVRCSKRGFGCAGKRFTQEPKCEKIMFGCDDIMSRDEDHPGETRKLMRQQGGISEADYSIEAIGKLVIVEGELDKMACNEVRRASQEAGSRCERRR